MRCRGRLQPDVATTKPKNEPDIDTIKPVIVSQNLRRKPRRAQYTISLTQSLWGVDNEKLFERNQ